MYAYVHFSLHTFTKTGILTCWLNLSLSRLHQRCKNNTNSVEHIMIWDHQCDHLWPQLHRKASLVCETYTFRDSGIPQDWTLWDQYLGNRQQYKEERRQGENQRVMSHVVDLLGYWRWKSLYCEGTRVWATEHTCKPAAVTLQRESACR